jgi:hypothetical protein
MQSDCCCWALGLGLYAALVLTWAAGRWFEAWMEARSVRWWRNGQEANEQRKTGDPWTRL